MKSTKISVLTSMYRCSKYMEGFFDHANAIANKDEVEILLLLNDPQPEEEEIIRRRIAGQPHYRYIPVPERESLYATWNRGIRLAKGKYIANWNIDDIRFPDSLEKQAKILDENPEIMLAYGDYYLSHCYGEEPFRLYHELVYEGNEIEATVSHIVGCFLMWRKDIHEEIGFFDEQFKLVGDYEFQIRCALRYPLKKAKAPLGVFFVGEVGGSRLSNQSERQGAERTCVERRYGIWYKMNLLCYFASRKMQADTLFFFGEMHPVTKYVQNYYRFHDWKKLMGIIVALAILPRNMARYLRSRFLC